MLEPITHTINDVMLEIGCLKEMIHSLSPTQSSFLVKADDALWTVDEVASYLRKSKSTIQSHYQNKDSFPRSKKIGNKRYWKPQEMIAYARKDKPH